jgi:hypothetical protein
VFRIDMAGGTPTFSKVHEFNVWSGPYLGETPLAGLVLDPRDGALYGTTCGYCGIVAGQYIGPGTPASLELGTVYRIGADGVVSKVYGDGFIQPFAPLLLASDGNLYGSSYHNTGAPESSTSLGSIFRVWLSPPVAVPHVVGLTQTAAEAAIAGAGLAVGTVTTAHSATVPAGHVLGQHPGAGTNVAPGSAVDLIVSLGPAPVTVPHVVGLTQAAAEAAIAGAGLVVGTVTTAHSATVPAGHVISQDPVDGTSVAPGSAVDLVVSLGPADSTPPVVGIVSPDRDALITSSPVIVSVEASDAGGVADVTVNGVAAALVSGTPQSGTWQADVPVALVAAALTFTATATDTAGNAALVESVVDNDGIAGEIDRNRATLADESAVFTSDFVHLQTVGTLARRNLQMQASVAGMEVLVRARGGASSNTADAHSLCSGAPKWVQLNPDEAGRVRCEGSTLYVTSVAGTIEVWRYDGRSCFFNRCTYYYTRILLLPGQRAWLGSPVSADPDNSQPVEVELLRLRGDDVEPDIADVSPSDLELYASLVLDGGESIDVTLGLASDGLTEIVTISVLSGTVDAVVSGETRSLSAGDEVILDAAPTRADQVITFPPLPDRTLGESVVLDATASSGLPVTYTSTGGCAVSGTTLTLHTVGVCTVTASQAGDQAYMAAPDVVRSFRVVHAWSGVLQPLNADGSSVFRLRSTIPIRFELRGGSAVVTDLGARLYLTQVSNTVTGTEIEASSTSAADSGNTFRYSDGQYIFNLNTSGLSPGTWQLRIDLLDGVVRTVLVSLRR